MKVLHLSHSDLDGGAARGSYWLHKGIIDQGVESTLLVKKKISNDHSVITSSSTWEKYWQQILGGSNQLYLLSYKDKVKGITPALIGKNITSKVKNINPDIINLHWIGGGFLDIKNIGRLTQIAPCVWTMRDMWAFTGGCHYSSSCIRYQEQCGSCPHLKSNRNQDLSRMVWKRKNKLWTDSNFTIVAISNWLADCARNSSLFRNNRIEVIHNALDEEKYKPLDKKFARNILNIPQDKKIILFGAISATTDERKGFKYLVEALKQIDQTNWSNKIEAVVFGSSQPQNDLGIKMKTHFLGKLNDDVTLALTYSCGDVMVVPSIEEAFGKTAIESLACGTPVVSFDSTGLKDIVEHWKNGYRAKCFSSEDLAQGIMWVLENDERLDKLSQNARKTVEQKFTLRLQAQRYLEVYREILHNFT